MSCCCNILDIYRRHYESACIFLPLSTSCTGQAKQSACHIQKQMIDEWRPLKVNRVIMTTNRTNKTFTSLTLGNISKLGCVLMNFFFSIQVAKSTTEWKNGSQRNTGLVGFCQTASNYVRWDEVMVKLCIHLLHDYNDCISLNCISDW